MVKKEEPNKEALIQQLGEVLVNGAAAPLPVSGNGHSALRIALHMVIDEAAEAEKYAAEKGLALRFDGADIRAMVNTVCIGIQHTRFKCDHSAHVPGTPTTTPKSGGY